MSGWEIAAPVLVGVVLLALLIFSILRPSSAVRFGLFVERRILDKEPPKEEPPKEEAPTETWLFEKEDDAR